MAIDNRRTAEVIEQQAPVGRLELTRVDSRAHVDREKGFPMTRDASSDRERASQLPEHVESIDDVVARALRILEEQGRMGPESLTARRAAPAGRARSG